MRKVFQDNRGISLIIAIIFVSAFIFVLADLAQVQINTLNDIRNRDYAGKANYLAQSAEEMAGLFVGESNVGVIGSSSAVAWYNDVLLSAVSELGITDCNADPANPCIGFEVIGRATDSRQVKLDGTSYYSAPVKGTGDAGISGRRGDTEPACTMAEDDRNNANDSCNWSKLHMGETVEIPMYYENEDGSVVKFNAVFNDFKLRLRAPPCTESMIARGECTFVDGRMLLFPMAQDGLGLPYRDPNRDPVLVQWLIADLNEGNSMVANDAKGPTSRIDPTIRRLPPCPFCRLQNTELSAGRINKQAEAGRNNIVLEKDQKGLEVVYKEPDMPIKDFITRLTAKPVLRLAMVDRPRRDDGNIYSDIDLNDRSIDVPYLEYQLLVTGAPVADSKTFVRAWAYINGFGKTIRKYIQGPTTLTGFAMESL